MSVPKYHIAILFNEPDVKMLVSKIMSKIIILNTLQK